MTYIITFRSWLVLLVALSTPGYYVLLCGGNAGLIMRISWIGNIFLQSTMEMEIFRIPYMWVKNRKIISNGQSLPFTVFLLCLAGSSKTRKHSAVNICISFNKLQKQISLIEIFYFQKSFWSTYSIYRCSHIKLLEFFVFT